MFQIVEAFFAAFGFFCLCAMVFPLRNKSDVEEDFEDEEETEYVDNGKAELERQAWRAQAKEKELSRKLRQARQARKNLEGQLK